MPGIIKYTIKYLFNDGLFGYFLNSIILNNRLVKICRELDALGFDSNVFNNFNLSRRDHEKDSVLLEKRRREKMGKSIEDLCRDFVTEMILGSMIASVAPIYSRYGSVCKGAATYDSPSNEKIDRTVSIESSLETPKNSQNTFASRSNEDSCRLKNTSDLLKSLEENENNEWCSDCSSRDSNGASLQVAYLLQNSTLNRRRRMVSLKSKIRRGPRLSLTFMTRVDPIFHESCQIAMKRKFQTINVCLWLSDVNQRKISNKSTVLKLRLILNIRRDYVKFKLTGRKGYETRSCLFFTNRRIRSPICQMKHRHECDDKVIIFKTNGCQKKHLPERHGKSRNQSLIENIDQINDNFSSSCSKPGKRLDKILCDRAVEENSCLPFKETPIVQRINKDSTGILTNKNEILNLTKEARKEHTNEVSKIIEDVCSQSYCKLQAEKIIIPDHCTRGNEEIINNCSSKMNIDSLTTRPIFSKGEVNSKCSCCSKVSSFSSAEKQNDEDDASNVILVNEEKLESKLESELEEVQNASMIASTMMVDSLFDISKKKDYQVLCPISRKNNSTSYDVSLSIKTTRMRRLSKFYTCSNSRVNPTSIIVPAVNIGVQISPRSKIEFKDERFLNDESSRQMKIEILSKEESKRLLLPREKPSKKRFLVQKYTNPWSSVCTCGTWTRSYNLKQDKLSRNQTWTSRIESNIGLRSSNSISKSFYESFYLSGKRSICRLRNVVRKNLQRFMRRDNRQEELSYKKNFFFDEKKVNDEEKKGTRYDNYFFYDLQSSSDDASEDASDDASNRCSKECRNNYLPISTRRSIKRIKSRSRNRDIFGKTKYFFEMKRKDGDPRRKPKQVNDRLFRKEKRMLVDLSSTMRNEDKSINDLGLDFRSKLEQYVSLCKNIKYYLISNDKKRDVETATAKIKNDRATIQRIAASLWSRSIFPGNRGEGAHATAVLPSVCNNASRLLTSSDGFEPPRRTDHISPKLISIIFPNNTLVTQWERPTSSGCAVSSLLLEDDDDDDDDDDDNDDDDGGGVDDVLRRVPRIILFSASAYIWISLLSP
ncbi:hypothetical protein M0802_004373 [Mischocyttarus mexicanus]|nr:hypothetical protein M0802_004373 [Mischocyttarus mexicanus]